MALTARVPEPREPSEGPEGPTRPGAPAADGGLRRALDVVAALALLALTSPLLVLGAVAIVVTSGRPALYGHRRVGAGGRPFRCWKLRTMEVDAEAALHADPGLRHRWRTNGYKLPADPRRTPVGRWLRRTYVDELPQLFNVLNGTMSLVGPRPVVREELEEFGDGVAELLAVRPGVFGAWNSLGRDRPGYPERARVELEYVRSRTPGRDVRILLSSLPAVLRGHPEDA